MMANYLKDLLDNAQTLGDIFEVVKAAVRQTLDQTRAGLMLGLADLGNHPQGFLGAFYPVGGNMIVMNRNPLRKIQDDRPELYKPYVFHILLHEYLHSLDYLDEEQVRKMVFEITKAALGPEHLATKLAGNIKEYMPDFTYPDIAWKPKDMSIDIVENFDMSSVNYIS
jgi:hypothetical protein